MYMLKIFIVVMSKKFYLKNLFSLSVVSRQEACQCMVLMEPVLRVESMQHIAIQKKEFIKLVTSS